MQIHLCTHVACPACSGAFAELRAELHRLRAERDLELLDAFNQGVRPGGHYEVVVRIPFKSRSQRTAAGLTRDVRIVLTQMLGLPERSKDVQVQLIQWGASDDRSSKR